MLRQELNALYERYGYVKYNMTKFEAYDLYADNRDFIKTNQLITFTDLDGSLLAMRPDVTLSIMNANTGGEEKVYYNEDVYRPKDNHFREIRQAGVECIGRIGPYAEAEVIALAAESMGLISEEYVIRVSDAAFLQELFGVMRLKEDTVRQILSLFSMKNAAGLDELSKKGKLSAEAADTLKRLMELYLPFAKGGALLAQYAVSDTGVRTAKRLCALSEVLDSFQVLPHIYLDFSLINSMDYYNGIIFQGAVRDIPFTLLYGGRYDRLPEKMGKSVEAIGFSINLDLVENYRTLPREYDADILLLYDVKKDDLARLARTVRTLTARGERVRCLEQTQRDHMERPVRAKRTLTAEEAETEASND